MSFVHRFFKYKDQTVQVIACNGDQVTVVDVTGPIKDWIRDGGKSKEASKKYKSEHTRADVHPPSNGHGAGYGGSVDPVGVQG